jgi:hypothetical protein
VRKVLLVSLSLVFISCGSVTATDLGDMTVVFLGASITEAFHYPTYDQFFPAYNFYKVVEFGPDKSGAFDQVESYNPDIVTFKECGDYFDKGGDTDQAFLHECMQDIADFCESIGATPVPATTLPIDVGHGGCTQAQLDDIIEFDNWVRTWCTNNGWACMDYYTWIADGQGQLPTGYHDGDGLHPNQDGYDVLGPHVVPTLEGAVSSVDNSSFGGIKSIFK